MDINIKAKAKNIKAIFFDIDGTLFSIRKQKVPQGAVEALKRAKQNGLLVFVATGRHRLQVDTVDELSGVEFDGYVTLNGQHCSAHGNEIYKNAIDPADVKTMIEYAQATPAPCLFFEADRMYVNLVDETVVREHNAVQADIPKVRDISRAFEREILQIDLYLPDEGIPAILDSLPSCTYTKWNTYGVDINPRGGNKWTGIEHIMKYFGLSRDEVMAFGDNDNDIEMLMYSGVSVAMGNAEANVKAVADYVTDDVDEDGVYNAMREFFD